MSWVTAWAMTCAVEWRRMWRPASVSSVMMATLSPSPSGRPRSTSSLSTVAATAALARRGPIDAATSAAVVPAGYWRAVPSGSVIVIGLTQVKSTDGDSTGSDELVRRVERGQRVGDAGWASDDRLLYLGRLAGVVVAVLLTGQLADLEHHLVHHRAPGEVG